MAFEFLNDMFDKIKKMLEPGNNDEEKLAPGTTRRLSDSSKNGSLSAKSSSASKPAVNSQKASSADKLNVGLFKPTVYEKCGIQQLDDMLDPAITKPGVIFLKTKNQKIEQFVENYKKEALKFGKVFEGIFSKYPSQGELDYVYDHFEDLHILRREEYNLGIAGWLPQLSLGQTSYIGRKAFGIMFDAASAWTREQGKDTGSIDVSPANAIICAWLRESIDIFENLGRVVEEKHTQKIYYKGPIKAVAMYYFVFLTAFGCDVLVDMDPSQEEPLTWVSQLPENMRVIEVV